MKRCCLLICSLIFHSLIAFGQQPVKPDTTRTKQAEPTIRKIELTPEAKEAIRKGTLISPAIKLPKTAPGKSLNQLLMPDIDLPNEGYRNTAPGEIPSYIFWLYDELSKADTTKVLRSVVINEEMAENFRNIYPNIVVGSFGLYTANLSPGITFFFSAEDILRTIFWPSHRAKKRNKKYANAWKHYNMQPQNDY